MSLHLTLLTPRFAVCRLPAGSLLPEWADRGTFCSAVWSPDETSVVCEETSVPQGVKCDEGWCAFKVAGPLDFDLTGVLLSIASPLADAGIGIFAVSTFNTDYVLVREANLDAAVTALREHGHTVALSD